MKTKLLIIGSLVVLAAAVYGKTATYPQNQSTVPGSDAAVAQRAVINQFCLNCHSDKARGAGMDSARKIDFDSLDIEHVGRDTETWERVVRKLRAGMMTPSGVRGTDPANNKGLM